MTAKAHMGVLSKAAIGKEETAWGTETAAYGYIPFNSEGLTEIQESVPLDVLGAAGQKPSEKGMKIVNGDLVVKACYYNALPVLLEAAMGNVSAGVYTLLDELVASMSIKIEKVDTGKLYTYKGCVINGFKISGDAKSNIVTVTATIGGKDLTVSSGSVTETPTTESYILMSQDLFRLADRGDALAAGDEVQISSFELNLDNNMKLDDVVGGQQEILQPLRNGFRKVTFNCTVPRVADDVFAGWQQGRTPLQADLYFSDLTKQILIEIPYLFLINGGVIPIAGAEIQPANLEFECCLNSTAIMGDVDNEFRVTLDDVI